MGAISITGKSMGATSLKLTAGKITAEKLGETFQAAPVEVR